MSKISHCSTKPFKLFTFLDHQNIKFSPNNDQREMKWKNSFRIIMTSPFFSYFVFHSQCSILIWTLKFWINFSGTFSNNVKPKLKMNQSWTRFRKVNCNDKNSVVILRFCKWNWDKICQISASPKLINADCLFLCVRFLLRVWKL